MNKILLMLIFLLLAGCNDYWWTRGQPPSVMDLIDRANERFDTSVLERGQARADFVPIAKELRSSLIESLNSIRRKNASTVASLKKCEQAFIALEGNLSIGSRAAYGELSSQFRAFATKVELGEKINPSAYGLLTSRSIFFLASELKAPKPSF